MALKIVLRCQRSWPATLNLARETFLLSGLITFGVRSDNRWLNIPERALFLEGDLVSRKNSTHRRSWLDTRYISCWRSVGFVSNQELVGIRSHDRRWLNIPEHALRLASRFNRKGNGSHTSPMKVRIAASLKDVKATGEIGKVFPSGRGRDDMNMG